MTTPCPHRIGFLAYDDIQLLDLVGPLECFDLIKADAEPLYESCIIAPRKKIRSETGIQIEADYTFADAPSIDTLVIPGGTGARQQATKALIQPYLQEQCNLGKRIVCICTGVFLAADLPRLRGLTVTTHWHFAEELKHRYPHLIVDADRLFIQHDRFYSSAGVLSGIDLALHIIEQDHGVRVATSAAKYLVTYFKRAGHQSQFSESLKFQSIDNDRLQKVYMWLQDNLHKPVSVTDLAAQCAMSDRHFNRLVQQHYQMTARAWLEHIKLEQAKIFLSDASKSIKSVAFQVGYQSSDSFGRAFKRKYGIEPDLWRQYFSQSL